MSSQPTALPPRFICINSPGSMRLSAMLQTVPSSTHCTVVDYLKLPAEGNVGGTAIEHTDGARQHELLSPSRTVGSGGYVEDVSAKMEGDSSDDHLSQDDSNDVGDYPSAIELGSVGETTFQLLSQEEVEEHGLQSVAISNDDMNGAATVVQYTHGADGQQIFIPVHQLGSSSMVTFPRSVVVGNAATTAAINSATACNLQLMTGDEMIRKRELRLMKNKEAAKECRRKKKEYVRCLENRVAVLENQNRTLIDELKSLKELYCQKEGHS